jgi:hypothetical protein
MDSSLLNTFYNKITNNIEFNTLYSMYRNILVHTQLDNYYSFMIHEAELTSTLTIALICSIKSLSDVEQYNDLTRKEIIIQYIQNTIYLINHTNYEGRYYESFSKFFVNIFRPKYVKSIDNIPTIVTYDYYDVQKKIDLLLNGDNGTYHDEYINITTLGFYSMLRTIEGLNEEVRNHIISNYMKCLVQLNIISDESNLFDLPHDALFKIDFTTPLFSYDYFTRNI